MAKRPSVTKKKQPSFLATIAQEVDAMSEAEIAEEIAKITVPVDDRYHQMSAKAHPDVLRACAYVERSRRALEQLKQHHQDMHDVMRLTGSEERTPEHRQVHLDILRAGLQWKMAETSFFTEVHLRHPEFMDTQNRAEIGTDGSIGWVLRQHGVLEIGGGGVAIILGGRGGLFS